MTAIQPGRLRDAREFLGMSRQDAAEVLGADTLTLTDMEEGTAELTGAMLEKMGRLYRRPLEWFTGGTRFKPSPDLLRMTENLHPVDRDVILEFAEWLRDAGPPPKVNRPKENTP